MRGRYSISKDEFYGSGGFSNPNLFRTQRGNSWTYWRITG